MNKFKAFLMAIMGAFSMNANSLRNLLTVVFGVGGVGLTPFFPHLNPMWGITIALWVRAGMDQFWPASGITKDWKNSLRNFLTVLVASGEVFHQFLPFLPVGSCASASLLIRAAMDQVWPAVTSGPVPVIDAVRANPLTPPFTALTEAKAKLEASRPPDSKGPGFEVRGNAILRVDLPKK